MSDPCAPGVYWFWSHVPDAGEIRDQVRAIVGAGFGMVMIQARLSLPRETYLSRAWLSGYREAVLAAGRAGLEVGIYDEYNWISGHGGGRTVAGHDELRERHLFWTSGGRDATVSGIGSEWIDGLGPAGVRWVYEDGVRRWDSWELVAAVAHPAGSLASPAEAVDVSRWARVTRAGDDGCAVVVDRAAPVPEGGVVTSFVSARCASSRLIDYLQPAAARRFVDVVYRPYLSALEGLIGDPVTCLSFDHPYAGFYDWRERTGTLRTSLPWHPSLLDGAAGSRGLLALVRDVGPETTTLRCTLFAALAARSTGSFLGALREVADEHGLDLTGHELLAHVGGWDLSGAFPELDPRTSFGADAFAVDRLRTATLVDASNFEAQLSPIMGDSVARAHGRSRCTVEQYAARREPPQDYAAGYWELSLPELRLAVLRLHLLGARRFLFHAFASADGRPGDETLLQNPRFDFPPACNFEPWFAFMGALSAESATVSRFIEEGEPVREIALVHPLHTLWARGPDHPHGRLFGDWAQLLARAGAGFDVVDDRGLDRAEVRDGRVWIGEHGYRAVVLAGVEVLASPRTAEVLRQLAAAGGTVVASRPEPREAADGRAVTWDLASVDAVPAEIPPALRALGDPVGIDAGDGAGTVWRWVGHDRVVLLNDGARRRTVTVGRSRVSLEAHGIACLRLPVGADVALPRLETVAELAGGWTLSLPDLAGEPVAIDPSRGWEQQGFPEFSGVGTYACEVDGVLLAERCVLELPVVHCAVSASLDGVELGERGWPPYRFSLPGGAGDGADVARRLVLRVASSAANRCYAGTRFQRGLQPSGLAAVPRLMREVAA